jgi:hypothetical protein
MSRPRSPKSLLTVLALLLLSSLVARAQNFEILDQQLDSQDHGYSVIRLWGSHYEMGFGMGAAFSEDIQTGLSQVKSQLGSMYSLARSTMDATIWLPAAIEDEISGIVAGVKSKSPDAVFDALDVKVLNTFGDWAYYNKGCRSHSCWGSFVQGDVKTLSTRRLDYSTPFGMALHHVLAAWDPGDGSIRWVNLAWPGYVTVVTGVNAKGTLVSLHDYGTNFQPAADYVTRSVAARYLLSGVPDLPLADNLAWATGELGNMTLTTGTFINYYVPEGYGGVFTCQTGGSCGTPRTPQAAYMNTEVLITTNSQTDGSSVPGGGDFMGDYYTAGGPKDLKSHFELMGTTGLHLMSVAYRGQEDMSIWFHGRGLSNRVEVEWSDLYPGTYPDGGPADGGPDAGGDAGSDAGYDGGSDAGYDAGTDTGIDGGSPDAGTDGGADSADSGDSHGAGDDDVAPTHSGGCGIVTPGAGWLFALLFLPLVILLRRRRSR